MNQCYRVSTYRRPYEHVIVPINGRAEWEKTGIESPLPPCEPRKQGRPENLRRRDPDEPKPKRKRKCRGGGPPAISIHNPYKLKKQQVTVTCSYCKERYHNILGCELKKQHDRENGISPKKVRQITSFLLLFDFNRRY